MNIELKSFCVVENCMGIGLKLSEWVIIAWALNLDYLSSWELHECWPEYAENWNPGIGIRKKNTISLYRNKICRYYLMHIKIRYWMRLISFHLKMLDIACGLLTISSNFYPRPVLAFGYCRCHSLSVCVSVCVCGNHMLVRAITHHPFELGSPNLDHRCKRPWLRSLLFWGVIDLDLLGQI